MSTIVILDVLTGSDSVIPDMIIDDVSCRALMHASGTSNRTRYIGLFDFCVVELEAFINSNYTIVARDLGSVDQMYCVQALPETVGNSWNRSNVPTVSGSRRSKP